MKARNDELWSNQLLEWEVDETSKKFRSFLVFWTDTMDLMLENPEISSQTIHHRASKALEVAEQTLGFLSVEWLSQMLLLLCEHHQEGDALYSQLTFIEKRLVAWATAMKMVDLAQSASVSPVN